MKKMINISEEYCPIRDDVEVIHGIRHGINSDLYSVNYKEITDNGDISYKHISISEALEKGLISAKYYEIINGKDLTEEEKQKCKRYMSSFSHCVTYNDNVSFLEYDEYNRPIKVQVKETSIKEMFPDQTVRSNNNNMTK